MKIRLIILVAVGVIGVIATPVSKQTTSASADTNAAAENVASETKHEESTLNNVEQKKVETIDTTEPDRSNDKDPNCDEKIDIIIEESVENEVDDSPNISEQDPSPSDDLSPSLNSEEFDDFPIQSPFTDTDVPLRDAGDISLQDAPVSTIQDEIMETAAGFIPTPLVFRRKNKPRRRFPNRRFFRPNPFRRKFHFYPYYGYGYGYYRPSSLRFF